MNHRVTRINTSWSFAWLLGILWYCFLGTQNSSLSSPRSGLRKKDCNNSTLKTSWTVLQMREKGNSSSQVTKYKITSNKAVTTDITLYYTLRGCPFFPPSSFSEQTRIGILFWCCICDMRNEISKQRVDSHVRDSLRLSIYIKTTYLYNMTEKNLTKCLKCIQHWNLQHITFTSVCTLHISLHASSCERWRMQHLNSQSSGEADRDGSRTLVP